MPTLIGTTPKFGIESDEAGLIIDALDYDFKQKNKPSMNKSGETQGLVLYDDTCDISVKGEIPVSSSISLRLAGTLSLTNVTPDHFIASGGGGRNVTLGVKVGKQREDFQKFEASSTLFPLIGAV